MPGTGLGTGIEQENKQKKASPHGVHSSCKRIINKDVSLSRVYPVDYLAEKKGVLGFL